MTVDERRTKIKELCGEIETRQRDLYSLTEACPHEIAIPPKFFEKLKRDRWHSATSHCTICGQGFGWFCPVNPKHICEYEEDDPCEDHCIHCGMPNERK